MQGPEACPRGGIRVNVPRNFKGGGAMDEAVAAFVKEIIGAYGFPIACCVFLFWRQVKESAAHKEEVMALRGVIEQNTLALQRLTDKMEGK